MTDSFSKSSSDVVWSLFRGKVKHGGHGTGRGGGETTAGSCRMRVRTLAEGS